MVVLTGITVSPPNNVPKLAMDTAPNTTPKAAINAAPKIPPKT
jgi:hypothetical protein